MRQRAVIQQGLEVLNRRPGTPRGSQVGPPCRNFSLALETGRFIGIAEEDRICLLCNLEEIESEVHLLFYCPLYDVIRHLLFSKMTSLCVNFFWLDDYEKLELCFSKGIFFLVTFFK